MRKVIVLTSKAVSVCLLSLTELVDTAPQPKYSPTVRTLRYDVSGLFSKLLHAVVISYPGNRWVSVDDKLDKSRAEGFTAAMQSKWRSSWKGC